MDLCGVLERIDLCGVLRPLELMDLCGVLMLLVMVGKELIVVTSTIKIFMELYI